MKKTFFSILLALPFFISGCENLSLNNNQENSRPFCWLVFRPNQQKVEEKLDRELRIRLLQEFARETFSTCPPKEWTEEEKREFSKKYHPCPDRLLMMMDNMMY